MRKKARQHLEEQLQRIAQQRDETKRKLRALARQTQREQRYQYGELVELTGLAKTDPETLFGGLCELAATIITDGEQHHAGKGRELQGWGHKAKARRIASILRRHLWMWLYGMLGRWILRDNVNTSV